MTLAAIDRLIHHATILEINVESYRRKEALDRKRSRGRPAAHTTPKELKHAPELSRELGFGRKESQKDVARVQAAVAARQFCNASLLRARSVFRETRWR
jgi:hypothetical protein